MVRKRQNAALEHPPECRPTCLRLRLDDPPRAKPSPPRHLAKAELADKIERALLRDF